MTNAARFPPTQVTDVLDLASVLYGRRDQLALTAEEVDDLAGFQERYTGKLENPDQPWGRGSLAARLPSDAHPAGAVKLNAMATIWVQTLGLRLVLMTAEDADRFGVRPAPPPLSSEEKYRRSQAYRATKARRIQ